MAASLLFACGMNEQKLPPLIHISEESNMDGSFLISSILCQRLRISNAGTLLICLQHTYGHYTKAGIRLGYDCNIFLNKTLNVIDPLSDAVKDFPRSVWLRGDTNLGEILLKQIQDHIANPSFNARIHNTVIIDNLAILYNLGATKEDLQRLQRGLMKLVKEIANLTIVTKISNANIYTIEDNNLSKWASIHLKLIKLKSGSFREVDGKMLIKRLPINTEDVGNNTATYECICTSRELLYKVNDRNIKIYNPGEIGLRM